MCTHPPSFLKQLKVAVPNKCFESHFPLLLPTIIHMLLPMHFQVTHPPKDGYWANLKTLHMSYGLRPTIYLTNPTSHIHCNYSHLPLIYLAHKDLLFINKFKTLQSILLNGYFPTTKNYIIMKFMMGNVLNPHDYTFFSNVSRNHQNLVPQLMALRGDCKSHEVHKG